jgi:hypothetical protein
MIEKEASGRLLVQENPGTTNQVHLKKMSYKGFDFSSPAGSTVRLNALFSGKGLSTISPPGG